MLGNGGQLFLRNQRLSRSTICLHVFKKVIYSELIQSLQTLQLPEVYTDVLKLFSPVPSNCIIPRFLLSY